MNVCRDPPVEITQKQSSLKFRGICIIDGVHLLVNLPKPSIPAGRRLRLTFPAVFITDLISLLQALEDFI